MTVRGIVTRCAKGWNVQTETQWKNSPHKFITNCSASTFKFALFKALATTIETPKGTFTLDDAVEWLKAHFDDDFHYCIDARRQEVEAN